MGFVGVLVILGAWQGVGGSALTGQLMCLGAATCYGFAIPYFKRFVAAGVQSGVAISTMQLITATTALLIISPIVAGLPPAPTSLSADVVGSILALGALGTGLAFVLNTRNIRLAGASTASTVTYVIPVVATILGVLVLDERLEWYQPVGAAIVLAGVADRPGRVPPQPNGCCHGDQAGGRGRRAVRRPGRLRSRRDRRRSRIRSRPWTCRAEVMSRSFVRSPLGSTSRMTLLLRPSREEHPPTEENNIMLLDHKNAVIYGAGGSVGSEVARTFAHEGAHVFLAGRTRESLDKVARDITDAGGRADSAVVDALDEQAVDRHVQRIVDHAGHLDVSLNLVPRGDIQGTSLVDLTTSDFTRAVTTGITTNFITARSAARQMIKQASGVIITLDSGSAQNSPMMGSTGPADAAIDTFTRNLALEVGPHGVRVLGLWVAGIPETLTPEKLASVNSELQLDDAALAGLIQQLDSMRILRRSPRLAEVAAAAAFLASDRTSLTGTFVNATGMFTS